MIDKHEIFDGIAGGGPLLSENLRDDVTEPKDLIVSTPTDRKIARIMALHPKLRVKFRNNNLSSLDEQTKQALLQDMQDILGINPLRNA